MACPTEGHTILAGVNFVSLAYLAIRVVVQSWRRLRFHELTFLMMPRERRLQMLSTIPSNRLTLCLRFLMTRIVSDAWRMRSCTTIARHWRALSVSWNRSRKSIDFWVALRHVAITVVGKRLVCWCGCSWRSVVGGRRVGKGPWECGRRERPTYQRTTAVDSHCGLFVRKDTRFRPECPIRRFVTVVRNSSHESRSKGCGPAVPSEKVACARHALRGASWRRMAACFWQVMRESICITSVSKDCCIFGNFTRRGSTRFATVPRAWVLPVSR